MNLTKNQVAKLQKAVNTRLSLRRELKMLLTARQVQKIIKLLQKSYSGMNLEMSATQLKASAQKEGKIIFMLAGLAMRVLSTTAKTIFSGLGVGDLSGFGSATVSKAVGCGLY